jgi:hypothetical protein
VPGEGLGLAGNVGDLEPGLLQGAQVVPREGLRRLPVAPTGAGNELVQGSVLSSDAAREVQVAALQSTVVSIELTPRLLSREVAGITPEDLLRLAVEGLEVCLDPACDLDDLDR